MNDNFKDGWEKIFNKRLLNEQTEVQDNDEIVDKMEGYKDAFESLKVRKGKADMELGSLKHSFDSSFMHQVKGTYSIGKHHFPFTTADEALKVFNSPAQQRLERLGRGNDFTYAMFLHDYQSAYKANRAAAPEDKKPEGAISHKPSDPNYRKPNTVYQQVNIQDIVNDGVGPIVAVAMAGPENLQSLKTSNPEIFEDPIVKSFEAIVKKKVESDEFQKKKDYVKSEYQKLKQLISQKAKPIAKPEDNTQEPEAPAAEMNESIQPKGQRFGPGKIGSEDVVEEQTETFGDVANRNKKALNESWKKYSVKNKDVQNTEKPDDFNLLMG